MTDTKEVAALTLDEVQMKLSERVTEYNARLLLHSVMVKAGLLGERDLPLNNEQAKNLCLELIKQGGPAFQVGRDLMTRLQ
jgi:hypothetical protein